MSAPPYHRARFWHFSTASHWEFAQVIAAHGERGGYVHITPEVFVLARPIRRDWSEDDICNPQLVAEEADCWHLWLLSGAASAAVRFLPYPLPFVSWHRRGKFRVHRLEDVLRSFAP